MLFWLSIFGFNHAKLTINHEHFTMPLAAEKEMAHIGETQGAADHDHDMIHDLSKRLDALWRYDQYIANAEQKADLQGFWRDMKEQEQKNVRRLKELVAEHCQKECF